MFVNVVGSVKLMITNALPLPATCQAPAVAAVGCTVVEKLVDFLLGRGDSNRIQKYPTQEGHVVGQRRELEILDRELRPRRALVDPSLELFNLRGG